MNNKINQEINIDDVVEKIYNDDSIPKFTFKDFLKYQATFYPEDKIEFDNMLMVCEKSETYTYNKVNNEHDKVFRTILSNKKEAVIFINKTLNLELKENEIEKYKENYITENLINKETDIVYKIKNKNVFILIEHQTKIDYSMPYRIMEYQFKITKSAVDIKKLKLKEYKIPIVIPIVLYTGTRKWNVKEYIKEAQESYKQYNGEELGRYKLVDVNNFTEEELLKEKTFLSKAMLIESKKDTEEMVECFEKIINILNKDKVYTEEQKHLLATMWNLIFRNKINNDNITDNLIRKINKEEEKEMLAILDTIAEENERILQQGIREGIRKTKINNAQKMKKANLDIKLIMEITGLSKKEIEKL